MTQWRALLWKEWLGLRWKLAALAAIPATVLAVIALLDSSAVGFAFVAVVTGYILIAPLFVAMHVAAGDRVDRTRAFSLALPASRFRLGLARVVAPIFVLVAPLLVATVLAIGFAAAEAGWVLDVDALARSIFRSGSLGEVCAWLATLSATTVSAYLWAAVAAMNQPTDVRAGVIGLATIVVWAGWTILSVSWWDNAPYIWHWMYGVTAIGPFAALTLYDPGLGDLARIAMGTLQLSAWCVLTYFAADRYGREVEQRGTRRPFGSPLRALLWMQARQIWPIAAGGLLTTAVWMFASSAPRPEYVDGFQALWFIGAGCIWGILAGIVLFSAELEPAVFTFWCSRPIDPGAWFRTKYGVGLLTLVAFVDLPTAWMGQSLGTQRPSTFVACLLCLSALHAAAYSVAVLFTCLVRHTIYSGILSMGTMIAIVILPNLSLRGVGPHWLNVLEVMRDFSYSLAGESPPGGARVTTYFLTTGLLILMTAFASREAVRHDVGLRLTG